ncbi:MAG: peptidoglycan-binding protein [Candidatus Paceibacterota bacterium]
MKKYIISAVLLALIVVPALSYGATDNSALIAQLRAQILLLQKQLLAESQPMPTCPFNKDLSYGQGLNDGLSSQVVLIQNALRASGYLNISKSTGYFGTMTRSALRNWQRDNNIQVTGSLRSLERSILCGRNDNGLNTIVINSVSGPTSMGVNQTGTWELKVTAPSDTNLNYTVDWGDNRVYPQIAGSAVSPIVKQTSTFTHAYSQAGTYTVRFMVDNGAVCVAAPCTVRKTAETSMTVVVGGGADAYKLLITYPADPANWHDYVGGNFSKTFSVANYSSSRNYVWSVSSGQLPKGLSLSIRTTACITLPCISGQECHSSCVNASNLADISGIPTQAGNFPVTLSVVDNFGNTGWLNININIEAKPAH